MVTPHPGEFPLNAETGRESVVIRDELHEILELLPAVPRLHKLTGLLRGREYDESDEGSRNEKVSKSCIQRHLCDPNRKVANSKRITTPTRKLKARYKRAMTNWIVD